MESVSRPKKFRIVVLFQKNASIIFILPDKEDDLFDLEASVATIGYIPLLRMARSTPPVNVDLWMPRFTLREDLDLGKTLEQVLVYLVLYIF